MLPRTQRLRDGREIGVVSRQGSRARRGDLGVAVRRSGTGETRAAVVVGKRAGGAVVRNRQRRRLQHALARVVPTLPAGTDVVVRGGPQVNGLSWPDLCRDLDATTRRALDRSPR